VYKHLKEEEKEKEREAKGDRVTELKKDYTVSITNSLSMVLSCFCHLLDLTVV